MLPQINLLKKLPITKKFHNPKKLTGFTIVELLLVVSIMGILSGLIISVLNSSNFLAKARDSRRISDLNKITAALERYYADRRSYPTSTWIRIGDPANAASLAFASALSPTYISSIPVDPYASYYSGAVPTGPCTAYATKNNYRYNYYSINGSGFVITAIMENSQSNDSSACKSLSNWASYTTWAGNCNLNPFPTENFCYGLQNP